MLIFDCHVNGYDCSELEDGECSLSYDFAAIAVYLISTFSSVGLIVTKSNYLTGNVKESSLRQMVTVFFVKLEPGCNKYSVLFGFGYSDCDPSISV